MIVSVSRRTDIPAFYSEWFMNRIAEGWFESVNPFNPARVKKVSLLPNDVDVMVFWSKNPAPMLGKLDELDSRGYRYYFQYTLNDYPSFVEPGVPALAYRLETFKALAERLGPGRVVWRYDPIITGNRTGVEYHLERFAGIAGKLSGYCERVVISFMDFYPKLRKRLEQLEKTHGFLTYDITLPEYADRLEVLAAGLSRAAEGAGTHIFSCSEQHDLSAWGIRHGSCIDLALINDIFNLKLGAGKDPNQRNACLCAPSVDMGVYNTCGHGCCYCYANHSEAPAASKMKKHDPRKPALA